MKMKLTILSGLLAALLIQQTQALEVDREVMPRITLGGRVIATLDTYDYDSDPTKEDEINLEDSSLLMRFDKRMFENGVAGAVIGLNAHDKEAQFSQLHAFYWNQDFAVELGRTRLRNTIIEFPLIRDDDFLEYTHVANASSNDEFDQTHGSQIAFDWFVDKKVQQVGAWAGTRRNGEDAAFANAPDGFDTYGIRYLYEQPETMIYLSRIRHAGITLDRQKVYNSATSEEEWISAVMAGIAFNLNNNPQDNWSMAVQAIRNGGADDVLDLSTQSGRAKAESSSLVASIRFTRRPNLLTRWQAGVNLGYKDYKDSNDASQWSIAPNFAYRIGQGVDLLAQAKYTDFNDGLGGGSDTAIQLGIAFSLESKFNDNIGERDSIMNLEHGYIQ